MNIKFLDLYEFKEQINYLSIDLIENIKQNLNYLSINTKKLLGNDINSGSIILRNLCQVLPFKLKYLSLNLIDNLIDLEIFLKNSQNTFIEKLLISIRMEGFRVDILPYIKEYIMKKKRVKYLAIMNTFIEDNATVNIKSEDLFSLKNEVKEFELYKY
ncbi:unnamed protein product [Rhizophagus irregularis]|nr:unnamed protein product [Rhizophagus irregularis]